jgi:hypothetical protein
MPTLEEDLADGLSITVDQYGGLTVRRVWFAYDLELPDPGDPEVQRFASALSLTGAPAHRDPLTVVVNGVSKTVYVSGIDVQPWPPVDAVIVATYTPLDIASQPLDETTGFSPAEISGGTTLVNGLSDFDAENREKALDDATRQTIQIEWDPNSDGPPASDPQIRGDHLPIWLPQSTYNFARFENSDPSGRSRDFAGHTNATTWRGLPPRSALCLAVEFTLVGNGVYKTTYRMAYDPVELWKQALRVKDADGNPIPLTPAQVAGENGFKYFDMQSTAEFNDLEIVTA